MSSVVGGTHWYAGGGVPPHATQVECGWPVQLVQDRSPTAQAVSALPGSQVPPSAVKKSIRQPVQQPPHDEASHKQSVAPQ
jgi:hypothetical protein